MLIQLNFNQLRTQRLLLDFTSPIKVALLFFYPKIAKFFSKYSGWDDLVMSAQSKRDLFERIIQEHSETFQEDNPRDFVDMYLQEVRRTRNKFSSFHATVGSSCKILILSKFLRSFLNFHTRREFLTICNVGLFCCWV